MCIRDRLMTFIINPPVAAINTALTNALNSMGGSSKVILGMLDVYKRQVLL